MTTQAEALACLEHLYTSKNLHVSFFNRYFAKNMRPPNDTYRDAVNTAFASVWRRLSACGRVRIRPLRRVLLLVSSMCLRCCDLYIALRGRFSAISQNVRSKQKSPNQKLRPFPLDEMWLATPYIRPERACNCVTRPIYYDSAASSAQRRRTSGQAPRRGLRSPRGAARLLRRSAACAPRCATSAPR